MTTLKSLIFLKEYLLKYFESGCRKQMFCGVRFSRETEFFSIKEIYGVSKMTETFGDAIAMEAGCFSRELSKTRLCHS
jgi:hypothetical protein